MLSPITATIAIELPGGVLAVARDFPTLVEALQHRAAALVANPIPYLGARVTPSPSLGDLGPLLRVLGLAIVVTTDPENFEQISHRLKKRNNASVRMPTRRRPKKRADLDSAWGRRMAALRILTQSRRERSRIAKHAALIRWADVKAAARRP
jgi:hypothetical protein